MGLVDGERGAVLDQVGDVRPLLVGKLVEPGRKGERLGRDAANRESPPAGLPDSQHLEAQRSGVIEGVDRVVGLAIVGFLGTEGCGYFNQKIASVGLGSASPSLDALVTFAMPVERPILS
jgi:hypothetical protein